MVRIFSSNNINNFVDRLETNDWSAVTNELEVDIDSSMFMNIFYGAYDECSCRAKLSRRRSNDKKWITNAF
jgi:hypothetical protein